MHDFHDQVDVLVGGGLFFGQALPTAGAGDHAAAGQLLVDAAALGVLDGGRATHHAARAVAGRAERLPHAALLAHQHPTGAAHVAGNDHRLADLLVGCGRLRMLGRKGPRRALAMHPYALAAARRPVCSSNLAMLCATSYTRLMPSSSQVRPNTVAKHSRACHMSSCRLHQAKFAAAHIAPMYCWPSGLSIGAQTSCRSGK